MGSLMNIQCVSLLCIFLLNMSACEDLKPPSVPDAIAVPSGRKAVRGFSGKGTIKYSFDGSQWQVDQMRGELDNIGSFYSNGKPDSHRSDFYLQTRNPNGWTVVGFITASITLSDNAIPWLLFKVTSSSGNVYVFLLLNFIAPDFSFALF
jgi:hypothetical protein